MSEPLSSLTAENLGLGKSLLERLFELYPFDVHCKLKLLQNFRSYSDIVDLSSHLFYQDSLTCNFKRPESVAYPISFHGVHGVEVLSTENPSYLNLAEATEVLNIVLEIDQRWRVQGGVDLKDISICVLSFYSAQVCAIFTI